MARSLSERERVQLQRAQATLLKTRQKLEGQHQRAQLVRDRKVALLLRKGVGAPAIANELNVTRVTVYVMARRAQEAKGE